MKIPLISYVAAGSQALPVLASLRYGRALPSARRWIVIWAVVLLLYDGLSLWFSYHHVENLWTGYVLGPLEAAAVLLALSYWQVSPRARTLFRLAIPVLVVVWVVLVAFMEDTGTFSLITGPLEGLLLFAASLATVLGCAWRQEAGLVQQDWFWICLGLALRYGSSAGLDPIARLLVGQDFSALVTLHQVEAWIDVTASLVIARGILCPILPLRPSSGPSSSASSPSRSSSPPSAPPW